VDLILVSGLSGAGKSVALGALADAGYYCVDNLPTQVMVETIQYISSQNINQLAISMDARTKGVESLAHLVDRLSSNYPRLRVLFLEASDPVLLRRFSETRRKHPLSSFIEQTHDSSTHSFGESLPQLIEQERELLSDILKSPLVHRIDTGLLSAQQLRTWMIAWLKAKAPLVLTLQSFGFKRTLPSDTDLLFDVRCLPNPHYEPSLAPLTGLDQPVKAYFQGFSEVQQMVDDIANFVMRWLPAYLQEGRSYLTLSVGCTGGQHRSVYVVEQLSLLLQERLAQASIQNTFYLLRRHRELQTT
jgi:UPF0042 nucleotide-binding protein